MYKNNLLFLLFVSTLTLCSVSLAETNINTVVPHYTWLPHSGRVLGHVTAASDVRIIGGDAMLPLYGDYQGAVFADFMGDYASDSTYLASPGAGYRKIINDQIVGGYLFGDNERTSLGTRFWVLSPGIEWMTSHWDAHVNGYFPTETSQQSGSADFASQFGQFDSIEFQTGTHNQYDELIAPFAVIGKGVDVEVGYGFGEIGGLRSRVYVGGYSYQPPSSDDVDHITGITAGFEHSFSKNLSASLFNSYDNLNNYAIGVRLTATFGQDSTIFSNNIQDRFLDPVQRHVGIIDTGAGTYDQQNLQDAGRSLQYDNVYFLQPDPNANNQLLISSDFSASASSNDFATYGNPAFLTQTTLDTINTQSPNSARIYLQGGTNANYYVNNNTAGQTSNPNNDYGLAIYDNQDLYGRSTDYTQSAASLERPLILVDGAANFNGFIISGSENTISDLNLTTNTNYINGTTATTATGIIAYNESSNGNQTINITNTNIIDLVDGMFAQNDSQTGTMTINVTSSALSSNGGDHHVDTATITGYKNYGASGLIAVNSANNLNALVINAEQAEFNNNGHLSGDDSFISNNNFSVASGMTVINYSNNGALTLNASTSTFDNNGTLSGDGSQISALEFSTDGSSVNIAAASGVLALNNTNNTGSLTINTDTSTFNNNGRLNGDNSSILAGGIDAAGDNANAAAATGIYAFSNAIDNASGSLNITAVNSEFNGNGTLSGNTSSIHAGNANISISGIAMTSAGATGIFAFSNSVNDTGGSINSTSSINIDAMGSQFNNNGTLSGDNSTISATTLNPANDNEVVAAGAAGIFSFIGNNASFSNFGSISIAANNSTFNGNGVLSGSSSDILVNDSNGSSSGSTGMASATGLFGFNLSGGNLDISATNSQFNNNAALSGSGSSIQSTGADNNAQAASGIFVLNNSGTQGNLSIELLSNSGFNGNGVGATTGYGIYGVGLSTSGTTVINYTGAVFSGSPQIDTNEGIGDDSITWIH